MVEHTPGSEMRVATRRPDGAWEFSDYPIPLSPSGASNTDVAPSPSSSKGILPPDMRIATRRPDGAWQFSDPHVPFTPSGTSDIDVAPSPSSYTGRFPPRILSRDSDLKASRNRYDQDREYNVNIDPPPPAYGYDYSGYIPSRKN
ncbi:hypothetical protein C0991_008610 [Blastosporella zonata]|nr:hypothetical protein C0991_008610 [Blastosporella zonata]